MDAHRRKGGGGDWRMSFRAGPFILYKNGCWCRNINSIAFGKSTSQRIYLKQHTPTIG